MGQFQGSQYYFTEMDVDNTTSSISTNNVASTGLDSLKNMFAATPIITAPQANISNKVTKVRLGKLSGADRRIAVKDKKVSEKAKRIAANTPKAKDPERLERTVFLGGVPINTMEKHVRVFLALDPHDIEACYFRSVPAAPKFVNDKRAAAITGEFNTEVKQTKNCYVVLKKKELVDVCVKKNFQEMEGLKIRVDRERQADNSFSKFDRKRSVYIGGFAPLADETKIALHFSKCGEVRGVRVIRDNKTNLCKGFGFVLFADRSSVIKCIQMMNGTEYEGKELEVTKALAEEDIKAQEAEELQKKSGKWGAKVPLTIKKKLDRLSVKKEKGIFLRGKKEAKEAQATKGSAKAAANSLKSVPSPRGKSPAAAPAAKAAAAPAAPQKPTPSFADLEGSVFEAPAPVKRARPSPKK